MELKIILLGLVSVFFFIGSIMAQENDSVHMESSENSTVQEQEAAVKFCLVCGPEEEMHGLAFSYKHKGTKYSFCSMDCLKAFKKDPEHFLNEEKIDKSEISNLE